MTGTAGGRREALLGADEPSVRANTTVHGRPGGRPRADGIEGTNPGSSDGDGDGLIDADEIYVYGTGAAVFDTDGDGVGDGEEVLVYGTDPNDPSSGP